jgi:hypothetical protein
MAWNYASLRLNAWRRMMSYTRHVHGRERYAKVCRYLDRRTKREGDTNAKTTTTSDHRLIA